MLAANSFLLLEASKILSWLMQFSILVPMVVVWRRRGQFPPAIRLLSWYVYLSLLSVVIARWCEAEHLTNWPAIAGFNFGKILLFTGVYYLALQQPWLRKGLLILAGSGLLVGIYQLQYHMGFVLTFSRVLQCALLAAYALAYLEQLSREPPAGRLRDNPLFLVSVGQLIYSAGTVMYFTLDYVHLPPDYVILYFSIVSIMGLIFNALLTWAFLRAKTEAQPVAGLIPG